MKGAAITLLLLAALLAAVSGVEKAAIGLLGAALLAAALDFRA